MVDISECFEPWVSDIVEAVHEEGVQVLRGNYLLIKALSGLKEKRKGKRMREREIKKDKVRVLKWRGRMKESDERRRGSEIIGRERNCRMRK